MYMYSVHAAPSSQRVNQPGRGPDSVTHFWSKMDRHDGLIFNEAVARTAVLHHTSGPLGTFLVDLSVESHKPPNKKKT